MGRVRGGSSAPTVVGGEMRVCMHAQAAGRAAPDTAQSPFLASWRHELPAWAAAARRSCRPRIAACRPPFCGQTLPTPGRVLPHASSAAWSAVPWRDAVRVRRRAQSSSAPCCTAPLATAAMPMHMPFATFTPNAWRCPHLPLLPACSGMGGGTDGSPALLVGLPGRGPSDALHAEVTSGTLAVAISGPGVESVPVSARGMRCISQASVAGGREGGAGSAHSSAMAGVVGSGNAGICILLQCQCVGLPCGNRSLCFPPPPPPLCRRSASW